MITKIQSGLLTILVAAQADKKLEIPGRVPELNNLVYDCISEANNLNPEAAIKDENLNLKQFYLIKMQLADLIVITNSSAKKNK